MAKAFLTLKYCQDHTSRSKVTDVEMSAFPECFLFYLFQVFALSVNVSVCVYVYVVHIFGLYLSSCGTNTPMYHSHGRRGVCVLWKFFVCTTAYKIIPNSGDPDSVSPDFMVPNCVSPDSVIPDCVSPERTNPFCVSPDSICNPSIGSL